MSEKISQKLSSFLFVNRIFHPTFFKEFLYIIMDHPEVLYFTKLSHIKKIFERPISKKPQRKSSILDYELLFDWTQ